MESKKKDKWRNEERKGKEIKEKRRMKGKEIDGEESKNMKENL